MLCDMSGHQQVIGHSRKSKWTVYKKSDPIFAVDHTNNSNGLVGIDLLNNLDATVGGSAYAESNKSRIGHLNENVVHSIDVDVLNTSRLHVLQDPPVRESPVETSIAF